jgi:hypothetical protein
MTGLLESLSPAVRYWLSSLARLAAFSASLRQRPCESGGRKGSTSPPVPPLVFLAYSPLRGSIGRWSPPARGPYQESGPEQAYW